MTQLTHLNVIDPTGLAEHVRACSQTPTHWQALHWAVEMVQGFFESRVVTSGLLVLIFMAMALAAV